MAVSEILRRPGRRTVRHRRAGLDSRRIHPAAVGMPILTMNLVGAEPKPQEPHPLGCHGSRRGAARRCRGRGAARVGRGDNVLADPEETSSTHSPGDDGRPALRPSPGACRPSRCSRIPARAAVRLQVQRPRSIWSYWGDWTGDPVAVTGPVHSNISVANGSPGAKMGANNASRQATSGHNGPAPSQVNGMLGYSGDIWRRPRSNSHRGGHWFDPSIAHGYKPSSQPLRTALIPPEGWELSPHWEEFGRSSSPAERIASDLTGNEVRPVVDRALDDCLVVLELARQDAKVDYPARRLVRNDVEDVSVMRPAGVHRELGKGVRPAADDDDGVIRRLLVAKVWPKLFPAPAGDIDAVPSIARSARNGASRP